MDTEQFYRTNDMAMATYLRMHGHTPQALEWQGDTCFWIFRATPHLLELSDKFVRDEALVNPREFNKEFGVTKNEFYVSLHDRRTQPRTPKTA